MPTPLLTTKLHIPPVRAERVGRPRLHRRLDGGLRLGHRLTLVSAPAGFGKTTLLSDWLARRQGPVAWLSLDDQDDDGPRFWAYLVAALQTVEAGLGQDTLHLLQAPQPPPTQAILSPLLNELAARAQSLPESSIVLVLDDYHHITAPQIHEGLAFLLEHQPPNLHLVISTRADPPLPTFRLRARGQLTEVRTDDLRFTPGEAADFMNSVVGLDLAPEDVEALEARTEGWIAGLQLAALAMQSLGEPSRHSHPDTRAFIDAFSGSHHYVLEYLTEEVVRRQSEPLRRFLMQTSILDRLCGPLCDAVCFSSAETEGSSSGTALIGQDDGDAVLADLQRRNMFILPLDAERRWYRYHHLFADLLGNLLRKEVPPEQVRDLHLRASDWHEGNGDLAEAIQYALRAPDYERAATLIEKVAQSFIAQGQLTTLLRWLESLPGDLLLARPRLRLYQGWTLNLSGQIDTAQRVLLETRADLQRQPPSPCNEALSGQLAALLTGIATQREDSATVIDEAQEALALLPDEDRISRARVYVALGTAHAYQNRAEEAARVWQMARDLALAAGNPFLATASIEMLTGTQIYHQGQLRAAVQNLQQALDLGTAPDGKLLPFSGTAHALLADVYLEWNDLERAAGYLETGLELLRQGGIGYGLIHTFCAKARLARAQGDTQGALQALETAEHALATHPLWHMVLHLVSRQVQVRLWLGDVETAARWAEGDPVTLSHEIPDSLPLYLREVQQISLARVHLARQDADRALAVLSRLEEQAQAAGRLAQAIDISLLNALSWQAQGQTPAAIESFERSLSWAEPEGYLRIFLEAGADVIPLLRRAASLGIRPGYVDRLLLAFGVEASADTSGTRRPDPQPLAEPLTLRELEVLKLICDGLSNREIANRLTVTLNTVKKHSSHIYGKLGVTSRAQAIVRARALELC